MFPTLGMSPASPLEDSRDGVEERETETHRGKDTERDTHTHKEKERHTEGRAERQRERARDAGGKRASCTQRPGPGLPCLSPLGPRTSTADTGCGQHRHHQPRARVTPHPGHRAEAWSAERQVQQMGRDRRSEPTPSSAPAPFRTNQRNQWVSRGGVFGKGSTKAHWPRVEPRTPSQPTNNRTQSSRRGGPAPEDARLPLGCSHWAETPGNPQDRPCHSPENPILDPELSNWRKQNALQTEMHKPSVEGRVTGRINTQSRTQEAACD